MSLSANNPKPVLYILNSHEWPAEIQAICGPMPSADGVHPFDAYEDMVAPILAAEAAIYGVLCRLHGLRYELDRRAMDCGAGDGPSRRLRCGPSEKGYAQLQDMWDTEIQRREDAAQDRTLARAALECAE